jgi:hypothetical protein
MAAPLNEKSNLVMYGVPTIASGFSQGTVDKYQKWQSDRQAVFDEYNALLKKAKPEDAAEAERRRMTRALDIQLNLGAIPFDETLTHEQRLANQQAWRAKQPVVPVETMHPDDVKTVTRFLQDPDGTRAREKKSDDEWKNVMNEMKKGQALTNAILAPYRAQHSQNVVRMMANYGFAEQLRLYKLPKAEFDAFMNQEMKQYDTDYDKYKSLVEQANKKRDKKGKEPIMLREKTYYPWEIAEGVWSDSDEEIADLLS